MTPAVAGDEGFVVWTSSPPSRSKSKGKRTVEGCARVRVLAVEGDRLEVVVLAGSGVLVGLTRDLPRREVFLERLPAEGAYFERVVRFLYGAGAPPGPRP